MSLETTPSPSAPSRAPVSRPPFRKDIEGLRGIAVLLVVLYHAGVPGFAGGYIGVDVFFVLSGYLITGILAAEVHRTGTLDLRRFYARRARRLLPAMAVLLVAVAAFAFVFYAPIEQLAIAETATATASYFSNFYFAAGAVDYLAADAETNPLLHTWSLSVEEQFYFVWPVFVLLALAGIRGFRSAAHDAPSPSPHGKRLIAAVAAVTVLSFVLSIYLMGTLRTHWAFFASPPRAWEFALGGLGALVPRLSMRSFASGTLRFGSLEDVPLASRLLGWLGLAGVLIAGVWYTDRTLFPGMGALLPALGTVFALRAGTARTDTTLARVLAVRPLQELGRLSYSWYLWHWPVLVFAAGLYGHLALGTRMALAAGSLVLAEASYRFVENPIRHHQALRGQNARGLALAGVLTAFGVTLGLGWHHAADTFSRTPEQMAYTQAMDDIVNGCRAGLTETEVKTCTFGEPTADTTIVLYGDSHADHLLPAMKAVAEAEAWQLVTVTHDACDVIDAPQWWHGVGRYHHECESWRKRSFAYLDSLAPAAIVVASSVNEPEHLDGTWEIPTQQAFSSLAATSPTVVNVRGLPRPHFELPACLARAAWRGGSPEDCAFDRDYPFGEHAVQQAAVAEAVDGVVGLDLSSVLCPSSTCVGVRDGVIMFRDNSHLAATYARSLAPHLKTSILSILQRRASES